MKLFNIQEVLPKEKAQLNLLNQSTQMIIDICKALEVSLIGLHCSLWAFQCNSIVSSFHAFDRYMYACGAVLVGTKLTQCLRNPIDIIKICRKILRKRKGLSNDEDTDDFLKKIVKRVFEAQVTIMINFGFDFDIQMALKEAEQMSIMQNLKDQEIYDKFKQALTSLYKTEVVVLFQPQIIIGSALQIVLKAQRINISIMNYPESLKKLITSEQVKLAKSQYLKRCGMV